MSLKSLFWKKIDMKQTSPQQYPRVEPGANLVHMIDVNKYIYFGGLNQKRLVSEKQQQATENKDTNQETESDKKPTSGFKFSIGKPSFNSFNSGADSTPGGDKNKPGFKFSIGPTQNNANNVQDFVYILDPATYEWKEVHCTGSCPTKRINYLAWYEAPYFFIYGGYGQGNKTLNDMYFLNMDTYVWKRFFWLEGPTARIDQQLINMGVKKFIIGGASMPENWMQDDIWSFSLENVVWNSTQFEIPGIIWQQVNLEQDIFQPLKAFSAVKVSDSQIFIFGGYNSKKQCTDTSILFDTEQETIVEFETKGIKPGPRAYHKMLPVKENVVCLFGGVSCPEDSIKGTTSIMLNDFYILNLKEGYWNRPNTGGYIPSPRYYFGMACNESEMATEILLLGGKSTESSCDKYLYVLSEIVKDQEEYWGERNDQNKLGFEVFREAVKHNKKKAQELKNVSITTLEFSQAEKMINDQRKKIGELETLYKKSQLQNIETQKEHKEFEQRIKDNRAKLDEQCVDVKKEIEIQKEKNQEISHFVGQVQTLLAYQRKKRKLLQLKSYQLQDGLRKAENLIITIDSIYNKGYKDDLIEGVLTEEALKKIERKKNDHKQQLAMFREDFENIFNDEKKIKQEIQQRKKKLEPDIKVSQDWKRFLSPEEKKMLDQKSQSKPQ